MKLNSWLGILLFSTFALSIGQCAKIIIYNPKFAFSHMNFIGRMADELHLAGHNVTVIQPEITLGPQGTGSKHAKVITIPIDEATTKAGDHFGSKEFWQQIWTAPELNPLPILAPLAQMTGMFRAGCENLLNQRELLNQLRNDSFDIAITELFDFCGIPFFHDIGVKNVIGTSTLVLMEGAALASGLPLEASYIPGSQSVAADDGSFYSRVVNAVFTYCSYKFQNDFAIVAQDIMRKRYPDAHGVWEFVGNMSIMFTNSDPLLDFPKPTLHKIVDLGGIGLSHPKPLDKKFSDILNLRNKTVLMSFGSVIPSTAMLPEMKRIVINVFKKFPEATFIWKYENPEDGVADDAANVILTKWAPQNDLLADSRLSFFITHGGVGSTFEAAARGVPLALFPMFGDQTRNARMAERRGFGFACSKHDLLDEAKFESIVRKGLYDQELHSSSKTVAELLKKRPFAPRDLLLKYVELAHAMGPSHVLSPHGRNMSFIVYHNLDLLAVAFSIVLFSLFVIIWLLRKIISIVSPASQKLKSN